MKKGLETKIINATFKMTIDTGWTDLTLSKIAAEAEIPLADVYQTLPSKMAILQAYSKSIDLKMLDASDDVDDDDTARDRLFDVVMNRFDAMAPDRMALQTIFRDLRSRPLDMLALRSSIFESLRWMLEAAHLDGGGVRGALRQRGLAVIYSDVFATWLKDDDPGLAKTMALLDRRLRRVEGLLRRIQSTAADLRGRGSPTPSDDIPTMH